MCFAWFFVEKNKINYKCKLLDMSSLSKGIDGNYGEKNRKIPEFVIL